MEKIRYRGVEKRRFQRLDNAVKVRVTILTEEEGMGGPKSFTARSKNISQEGICIETRQIEIDGVHILSGSPRTKKNQLDMEIELYPGVKPVKVMGEVCWYDLSQETEEFIFEVGIVFISMDSAVKESLRNFIKQLAPRGRSFLKSFFNKFHI